MSRPTRIELTICALVGFSLAITAAVSLGSDSRRATASTCTAAALGRAAGKAASHFTLVRCADGWALAAGLDGAAADIDIFRQDRRRWTQSPGFAPARLLTVSPAQFADVGISPHLLRRLARPFPVQVRQVADAGTLVEEMAAREARVRAPGSYQASKVLGAGDETWFVLAGSNSPINDNSSVTASPYPDGTVRVYRWSSVGWIEQGAVRGWMGPISGCCGISAIFLTGSHVPDFAVTGGGAADTNWLSVVSDIGRHWHLLPFDYRYTDTTVVNGGPAGNGVATEVDATSSAAGPTTWLFETYSNGVFRPASPPGPRPPCSLPGLQAAADAGRAAAVEFIEYACADGWAMAVGTRDGYPGQVVGLFDASRAKWAVVELDSGGSLGCDPGIYDIPLPLLRQLAVRFGSALQPELATAPLIATNAMTGWPYLSGVITVGGVQWFIAERPTGGIEDPGATATVYRWSGSAWLRQGVVDHVPASLNYYVWSGLHLRFGQFEAVTVAGAADSGFVLEGSGSSHPDVLTDAGGRWHYARSR